MASNNKMSPREKVEKVKTFLVIKHAFFGVLLSMMEVLEDETISTMATDGCRLYYNPHYIDMMTEKELRYVVLHETLHVAYMHCSHVRMFDRDHRRWNYACDYVINLDLENERRLNKRFYEIPKTKDGKIDGLLDNKFEGKIAERVYKEIPDDMELRFVIGRGSCPRCHGSGTYRDHCDECFGTGVKTEKCKHCDGSGEVSKTVSCPDCNGTGLIKHKCEKCGGTGYYGELKECGCDKLGGFHDGDLIRTPSKDDINEMREKIIQAYDAVSHDKRKGLMPAGLIRAIERMKNPRVPWQRIFWKFVGTALAKDDFDFSKPNRRFLPDLYLPDLRNNVMAQVVIAFDTSGSISMKQLGQFNAEFKKISTLVEEVIAITCDAAVHEVVKVYRMQSVLDRIKFKGHGGTDFRPVFDYVKDKGIRPDVLIYLTDSYGTFPKNPPNYPVLWVVTEEVFENKIPWGTKVVIPGGKITEERGY